MQSCICYFVDALVSDFEWRRYEGDFGFPFDVISVHALVGSALAPKDYIIRKMRSFSDETVITNWHLMYGEGTNICTNTKAARAMYTERM